MAFAPFLFVQADFTEKCEHFADIYTNKMLTFYRHNVYLFYLFFINLQYYLQRYTTYTTRATYNTVLYYVFFPFCTHNK